MLAEISAATLGSRVFQLLEKVARTRTTPYRGAATAEVEVLLPGWTFPALSVGERVKLAAALPVVTQETSHRDLQKFHCFHVEQFPGRFFIRIFLAVG